MPKYNNVSSQHTGSYQTCAMLISKNCAPLQVLQLHIPRKYLRVLKFIFHCKHVIGTIKAAYSRFVRLLMALLVGNTK
jgi:hypothetical protein